MKRLSIAGVVACIVLGLLAAVPTLAATLISQNMPAPWGQLRPPPVSPAGA